MQKARVSIVAALGKNREIGHGNELLWHIPDDLKRFKALTLGHPVIVGRKTYDSILKTLGKPLPGRVNIVVTRDPIAQEEKFHQYVFDKEVFFFSSIEEALAKAATLDQEEIFIIGGANVWEQSLPFVDTLYLTLIDGSKDGDTFFPPYETVFAKKVFEETREHEGLKYTWIDLEK